MDDHELLELAAKAAGIPWIDGAPSRMGWAGWNPLTSNGDALRLAIKLLCDLTISNSKVKCVTGISVLNGCVGYWVEDVVEDIDAATRRAIVRAAAELGKKMEKHPQYIRRNNNEYSA